MDTIQDFTSEEASLAEGDEKEALQEALQEARLHYLSKRVVLLRVQINRLVAENAQLREVLESKNAAPSVGEAEEGV